MERGVQIFEGIFQSKLGSAVLRAPCSKKSWICTNLVDDWGRVRTLATSLQFPG